MYFTKGDYGDTACHFHVAMERFIINITKSYKKEIREPKNI
jgi:hypothetical protein